VLIVKPVVPRCPRQSSLAFGQRTERMRRIGLALMVYFRAICLDFPFVLGPPGELFWYGYKKSHGRRDSTIVL
jgi:hypothetical protein